MLSLCYHTHVIVIFSSFSLFSCQASAKRSCIFHFSIYLKIKCVLYSNSSIAHRCSEPQESGILFRPLWVLGGWSGAEVPLWHPLFHLQLHPDVATAYRKCSLYKKMHKFKMTIYLKSFATVWLLLLLLFLLHKNVCIHTLYACICFLSIIMYINMHIQFVCQTN